jgi:hypothetical protein
MALDAATEAVIRLEYETSALTLDQIGAKQGRTGAWVCKLAKLRGWKRRAERNGRAPPRARPPRNKRAALANRMCKVINAKLKRMEMGMKTGELSSADLERDAKMLGSLIGGMEKVEAVPEGEKVHNRNAAKVGANDDVERLQREIIERFERIQRRREAERGSQ